MEPIIAVALRTFCAGQHDDLGPEGNEHEPVEDQQVHRIKHQQHHKGAKEDRKEEAESLPICASRTLESTSTPVRSKKVGMPTSLLCLLVRSLILSMKP